MDPVQQISYFTTKLFDSSLRQAFLSGGQQQKKALKVKAILGSLREKDPFIGTPSTNHGENRIKSCVKYDLGDGWRLVTQQTGRACLFLFIGDHEDVDRWLDRQRGILPAVENFRAVLLPGSGQNIAHEKNVFADHHYRPLADRIAVDGMDHVLNGLPRNLSKRLETLDGSATTSQIEKLVSEISESNKAELVRTVFNLLLAGDEDGAQSHINLSMGRINRLEEVNENEMIKVTDGDEIRRLRLGSVEYEQWLAGFEKHSQWYEWFLYLHPEQEKVVKADYVGVSQLSGVSGSGKTCVAVRRALRLADAPTAKILLLTLNRSLAKLLERLVDAACTDEAQRNRIEVISYFEFAQKLLLELEPKNLRLYSDETWKLREHVDEIFREYYRQWTNNNAAKVLFPIHKSLTARRVAGESYIREEFDWIRSAVSSTSRNKYIDIVRQGRKLPILADQRSNILEGLNGWEKKMRDIGVIDYLGLTSALTKYLDQIKPRYTNVLVDEAQDFGTTELSVLRKLVDPGPNDIFLCGDIAQTILPKHRSLAEAGLVSVTRERIQKNYRNSREILKAAYEVLSNNLHDDMFDSEDLEILDPKFANFTGPVPMALAADSLEDEIAFARAYAETALKTVAKSVCIAFAGFTARDVKVFAGRCGITALDGAYNPSFDRLVFCDLEQSKGYEFDTLIILNCSDGVLPPYDAPEEEAYRASCKLYVAMTRAKRELILSFHGTASRWITEVAGSIGDGNWCDFEVLEPRLRQGIPALLPDNELDGQSRSEENLTGSQFLYTMHALGLSIEAQEKLVEVVDGRGLRSAGGRRLRWKDMNSLFQDLNESRRNDSLFGPKVAEELRNLSPTTNNVRSILKLPK